MEAYEFHDLEPYTFQANTELRISPRSSPQMSRNMTASADFENSNLHPHPPWSMTNQRIEQTSDIERVYPTADRNHDTNAQYDGSLLFEDTPTHMDYSFNVDNVSDPPTSSSRTMRRKELFAGPAPSEIHDRQVPSAFGSSGSALQEISRFNDDFPPSRRLKRRREESPDSGSPPFLHERMQQQSRNTLSDDDHGEGTFQQPSHFDHVSDTEASATAIDRKGKGKESYTYKGKGKERAIEPEESEVLVLDEPVILFSSGPKSLTPPVVNAKPQHQPLSSYTCPICFSAPTNATITPCGHICCGECLFTAVKTTIHRATLAGADDASEARCPVCRAAIPGWDGKGGGVIGLKPRAIFSL